MLGACRLDGALATGCTPTGVTDREVEVEPPLELDADEGLLLEKQYARLARAHTPDAPHIRCGFVSVEPAGLWEQHGERLAAVRASWHPRPEHGSPTMIRTLAAPVPMLGHELVQVRVMHSPRVHQSCWLSGAKAAEGEDGYGRFECLPAEVVIPRVPAHARPQRARPWAELLGTFDDATAVLTSERELDRCVSKLPADVRALVPRLGVQRLAGEEHITFVEWIDVDNLTLLLTVQAVLQDEQLDIERHELMTFERYQNPR